MTQSTDYPAWIALLMGLFSLAAALGEWRVPGTWGKMLDELASSPALLVTIAVFETSLGTAIYLVIPWNASDGLGSAMKVLGGLMAIEGLLIVAFGDRIFAFLSRIFAPLVRAWLAFAAVAGVAMVAGAISRI